jgi:hypothetical protein
MADSVAVVAAVAARRAGSVAVVAGLEAVWAATVGAVAPRALAVA